MKKILLPVVVSIGVLAGLAGITLIRLSKSMEDWEVSWDEEKESNGNVWLWFFNRVPYVQRYT